MLKVRRTLTEILLEVTTEEMTAVAREVYQKARAKGTTLYTVTVYISKLIFFIWFVFLSDIFHFPKMKKGIIILDLVLKII